MRLLHRRGLCACRRRCQEQRTVILAALQSRDPFVERRSRDSVPPVSKWIAGQCATQPSMRGSWRCKQGVKGWQGHPRSSHSFAEPFTEYVVSQSLSPQQPAPSYAPVVTNYPSHLTVKNFFLLPHQEIDAGSEHPRLGLVAFKLF